MTISNKTTRIATLTFVALLAVVNIFIVSSNKQNRFKDLTLDNIEAVALSIEDINAWEWEKIKDKQGWWGTNWFTYIADKTCITRTGNTIYATFDVCVFGIGDCLDYASDAENIFKTACNN